MDKTKISTIPDLARESAKENGERVYIREKAGKDISDKTFNEFYNDACRVCSFVNEVRGGGEPVHAAVIGPSSYAWIVSYFGTVFGGNAAVPLDALLTPEGIIELLNRSDSVIFFYDARYEKLIPALKQNCPNVVKYVCINRGAAAGNPGGDIELSDILEKYALNEPAPVSPDALAAISYTSGTTGKSKGVMLLNRNFIDNTMCSDNESDADGMVLSVLPIHHIYCFTCDILLTMRYGSQLCLNDSLMHIAQKLKLFQPTIMLVVPMIAKTITPDGWLRTGDLGYVDEENRIFLTGRKKNLIILSGGENVSPEELENKFDELDFVAEVMVYDDDDVLCAEVFPNPDLCGNMPEEELVKLLKDAVAGINKTLPASKAMRRIRLRDAEFEKTTSKKIIRNQSAHGKAI